MIKANAFVIVSFVAAVFAGRESALYPQAMTTTGTVLAAVAGLSMFAAVTFARKAGLARWEEG